VVGKAVGGHSGPILGTLALGAANAVAVVVVVVVVALVVAAVVEPDDEGIADEAGGRIELVIAEEGETNAATGVREGGAGMDK
jgi:hypothetical protein